MAFPNTQLDSPPEKMDIPTILGSDPYNINDFNSRYAYIQAYVNYLLETGGSKITITAEDL